MHIYPPGVVASLKHIAYTTQKYIGIKTNLNSRFKMCYKCASANKIYQESQTLL